MLRVTIEYDHDTENPCEYDGWKVYSFNSRHVNHESPDNFDPDELDALVQKDLAFILDYYEHGLCQWSLHATGPSCRWDTSRKAGILRWEGKEEDAPPNRVESARRFLEDYTAWCNGECYGYTIERLTPCPHCGQNQAEELDSCWGFIGYEDIVAEVKDAIDRVKEGDEKVTYAGEAKGIML